LFSREGVNYSANSGIKKFRNFLLLNSLEKNYENFLQSISLEKQFDKKNFATKKKSHTRGEIPTIFPGKPEITFRWVLMFFQQRSKVFDTLIILRPKINLEGTFIRVFHKKHVLR